MASGSKKKLTTSDYKHVDAYYTDKETGVSSAWKRIDSADVQSWQQQTAYNFNCFASIQRFASSSKEDDEAFIAPLYFDLDYETDPEVSKLEAVKLVDFFINELDCEPTDIWTYFSGSKGFHVLVSSTALDIQPSNTLHKAMKHVAGYLRYRLGDTVIGDNQEEQLEPMKALDLVVYGKKRMLRLPNSIHAKTNLYKVELTIDELRKLTLDQIKGIASQPRRGAGYTNEERAANMKVRSAAAHFFRDKYKEWEEAAATAGNRYDKEQFTFEKGNHPECVKDILAGGWKKEGDRNNATVQLACYLKDAGYEKEETGTILGGWVLKFTSADTEYQKQQRVSNTKNVVESVYSGDGSYKFGCAFIRSLHGERAPGSKDYERVPCSGALCPCLVNNTEQAEDEAADLHLAHTGSADYTGKLVKTRVMVVGKKHTPYIVPKKIEYTCWGKEKCKKYGCPLFSVASGVGYKDLGVMDRELVQMCGIGDDNIKGILKQLSGVPNCMKYDTEITETVNVDELLVIPKAEDDETEIDEESRGKYVLRKVYAVGNDTRINENKYYELLGYVYPHPKNQEGTILIKKAIPLQDVIEQYNPSDEVKKKLEAFQPLDYTLEGIHEKLTAVCNDLTHNVTKIMERDETLMAVLLTYHSVLRFNVPWDSQPIRGWVESIVIGDTGTGKSALVEKIQKHAGLGSRINAESSTRTGLTYKMEQTGTGGAWFIVWGAWPLADKELIWIDEATGIPKEEYGQMTLARSDGRLEVKRAVTAETPCRVRAILSGNVANGKRLADYSQGVESLRDIFNNEDIRRFDIGVFMRASDVNPELYNQTPEAVPVIVDTEAFKNNILFSWSRSADQVMIPDETIDTILEASTELSKVYGNATDVPLVSPSDQRNKIARLAVSLAALMHSVDESGDNIVVYPGHVEYIFHYLKMLYNAPGCALNYYAKLSVKEEDLDRDKYDKITAKLQTVDTIKHPKKFGEMVMLFAQQKYLRQGDMEAMLSIDKDECKAILHALTKIRMIETTSGGFRKTSRFNAYIAKSFEAGLFEGLEDNDDFL